MNPMSNVKGITRLNETELKLGVAGSKTSWHNQYKDSAWIFMGGLPYDLSEGDIICVFSQYGEIVNVNLVRDKSTGKFKGYGFLCYENQKSTILAVDNLNGIKLLGRTIRVDHVSDYRKPKEFGDEDEITQKLRDEGCAPRLAPSESEPEPEDVIPVKKPKKEKKKKKEKKSKKKHKKRKVVSSDGETDSDSSEDESVSAKKKIKSQEHVKVKQEKHDPGYDKYSHKEPRKHIDPVSENKQYHNERERDQVSNRYTESQRHGTEYVKEKHRGERDDRRYDRQQERDYTEKDRRKDRYDRDDSRRDSRDGHRERSGSIERNDRYRDRNRSRERQDRQRSTSREKRDRHRDRY